MIFILCVLFFYAAPGSDDVAPHQLGRRVMALIINIISLIVIVIIINVIISILVFT